MLFDRNRFPTLIHLSILGCGALISQTIIIRELLALFRGLESTIGLLLAAWLFWTGAGGLLSFRLARLRRASNADVLTLAAVISSIVLPLTILLIRYGRGLLALPPGSMPPVLPSMVFSVAVIAFPAFISGMIYSSGSIGLAGRLLSVRKGITLTYIAEVAGAAVGAILFSMVLAGRVSHTASSLWISISLIVVSGLASRGKKSRVMLVILLLAASGCLVKVKEIDHLSQRMVFGSYEEIVTKSSRYGELVAAVSGESVSYFLGGSRLFSYPEPERAEEAVHLALLAHPRPEKVLLVGGSLGGVIAEVLSHPSVDTLHCVEIDDALSGLFESTAGGWSDGMIGSGVHDKREVVRSTGDGRRFISRSEEQYDLIIVNAPPPLNLQWNRYYTREFFEKGSSLLRAGGLFAISHSSAEEYIGHHLAGTLGTIGSTMRAVFPFVTVLPGSRAHFIGAVVQVDTDSMITRIGTRRLDNDYISEIYLPERLSADRMASVGRFSGETAVAAINRDHYPLLMFQETILEAAKRDREAALFLDSASKTHPGSFPVMMILAGVSFLFFRRRGGLYFSAVFLTGFSAFIFQMMILFMFQTEAGVIYHSIILLSAVFMAGAAVGAGWLQLSPGLPGLDRRRLHLMIAVCQALFIIAVVARSPLREMLADRHSVYYVFSFLNGIMTGAYYHLSVDRSRQGSIERIPGLFYAADLFGACAGGLVAGMVLLPLSGIYWTASVVLVLNLAAAVVLPGRGRF